MLLYLSLIFMTSKKTQTRKEKLLSENCKKQARSIETYTKFRECFGHRIWMNVSTTAGLLATTDWTNLEMGSRSAKELLQGSLNIIF